MVSVTVHVMPAINEDPQLPHPAVEAAEIILRVCRVRAAQTDDLVEALQGKDLGQAETYRIAAGIGYRLRTLYEESVTEQARFFEAILDDSALEHLFARIPDLGPDALQLIRQARDRMLQR